MQAKVSRLNSVLHGDRVEHKRSRGWHHSMEASVVWHRTLRLSFPSSISANISRAKVSDADENEAYHNDDGVSRTDLA